MTAKSLSITCAILAIGGLAGFSLGSSNLRRLSAAEFLRQAEKIEEINSAEWTGYVGCSGGRAYLEQGRPGPFGTTVYWVQLSELPPDLEDQLREGNPPWVPPDFKAKNVGAVGD
ncbi:hypothetical protein [Luteolibacter marinus]|uniref:hypothetical protein n=1 Tax=Luteolibacter marinus TaxID=2776705 RepID=UPI001869376C|nr:hypothetical protein [Luteolibacter marinus]